MDNRGDFSSTFMEPVWSGQQGASSLVILDQHQDQLALVSALERSALLKQSPNGGHKQLQLLEQVEKRAELFQPRETQNREREMLETEVKKADGGGVKGARASSSPWRFAEGSGGMETSGSRAWPRQ